MDSTNLVELVGGPLDGERIPSFNACTWIPISNGEWARWGDPVREAAKYVIGFDGRAYYRETIVR